MDEVLGCYSLKIFVYDTETSGLVENRTIKLEKLPEIIEFYGAYVDLATGEVEMEIDTLIKPQSPIASEITKITTITNEMLKDAPPFSELADIIADTIGDAGFLLAHNASFDKEMVDIEFERLGRKIKWGRILCSVEATIHLKGYRLSLSALHEELFGEPFAGAHRAKVDVTALIRCARELYRRGDL